jgi:hypothetical protein
MPRSSRPARPLGTGSHQGGDHRSNSRVGLRRPALFDRKREVLEKARALLAQAHADKSDQLLRALRQDEVKRMCAVDAEFSAMVQRMSASSGNPQPRPQASGQGSASLVTVSELTMVSR